VRDIAAMLPIYEACVDLGGWEPAPQARGQMSGSMRKNSWQLWLHFLPKHPNVRFKYQPFSFRFH
jgi:hypothetical protein